MYRDGLDRVTGSADRKALGRTPDFLRLWTGGAVSALGSSVAALAYPLLALGVTRSAAQAGLLSTVALGAGLLMRLPAGVLLDRLPLKPVLVVSDLLRAVSTLLVVVSLVTGHLSWGELIAVAAVNAACAVFADAGHSIALRHVVPPDRLPHAFALNDGRGHAVGLVGQSVGGYLYGVAPGLSLLTDAASFLGSALLSGTIRHPMRASTRPAGRSRRPEQALLTGLRFLWAEPFLRATLLAAAGFQFLYGGATFALIAHLSRQGHPPGSLGLMLGVAAGGGILGALAAPALQARYSCPGLMAALGWSTVLAFGCLAWVDQPLVTGLLLGMTYFLMAPANALLSAGQIERTPAHLQGRVIAASFLIAGIAAPLGPPLGGALLDGIGPATFLVLAAFAVLLTVTIHRSRALRAWPRGSQRSLT